MPALTYAAALALAANCGGGLPPVWLAGIALNESNLMPGVVSAQNHNGTHDRGLGQINDATLSLVGLTRETALDECQNMAAIARYLWIISGYHTGPAGAFDRIYIEKTLKAQRRLKGEVGQAMPIEPPDMLTLSGQTVGPSSHRIVAFTLPQQRNQ